MVRSQTPSLPSPFEVSAARVAAEPPTCTMRPMRPMRAYRPAAYRPAPYRPAALASEIPPDGPIALRRQATYEL
jgi:hypothetical protein